jgi:hypothetical protein
MYQRFVFVVNVCSYLSPKIFKTYIHKSNFSAKIGA